MGGGPSRDAPAGGVARMTDNGCYREFHTRPHVCAVVRRFVAEILFVGRRGLGGALNCDGSIAFDCVRLRCAQ